MTDAAPRVSVIVPSRDGHRDGCVPRLVESIEAQTYRDYELLIIKGVFPQGKAINEGAAQAKGEILLILDDDSRLAHGAVFERLVAALDADPTIGFAGASIAVPLEASAFQRRAARQFPRYCTPEVPVITDSDLACHGCVAMPRAAFEAVGREREDIIRGLDPDLRVRMRTAGYRVVLVPGCTIYHPLPDGLRPLLRVFFRNGFGSAYARRFQPDSVYETHESLHEAGFQPRTSLAYRVARFPARLFAALARRQVLRFAAYTAYAGGYCWGLLTAQEDAVGRG